MYTLTCSCSRFYLLSCPLACLSLAPVSLSLQLQLPHGVGWPPRCSKLHDPRNARSVGTLAHRHTYSREGQVTCSPKLDCVLGISREGTPLNRVLADEQGRRRLRA